MSHIKYRVLSSLTVGTISYCDDLSIITNPLHLLWSRSIMPGLSYNRFSENSGIIDMHHFIF